jgi:hypothetical protein
VRSCLIDGDAVCCDKKGMAVFQVLRRRQNEPQAFMYAFDPLELKQFSDDLWPFEPSQSGNPAGKAKGTRNKVTLAIEALLDGEAEALTRKAIELAKAGDILALRLCMFRIRLVAKRAARMLCIRTASLNCSAQ